jgi:hypothetical protein
MAKSVSKREVKKVLPVVPVVGAALAGAAARGAAGAAARSVAGKAVGKAAGKAAKETIARATKLKNEARATVSANLKKARVMSNPGVKKYYYKQVNDALKMVSQANAQLRKLQKNIGK